MKRVARRKKEYRGIGMSAMVYRGEFPNQNGRFEGIAYNQDSSVAINDIKDVKHSRGDLFWLNYYGISDVESLLTFCDTIDVPKDAVPKILNTYDSTRIIGYPNGSLILMKKLAQSEEGVWWLENVSFYISAKMVVCFRELDKPYFQEITDRIMLKNGKIQSSSTDYLLYNLLQLIVEDYSYYLVGIADRIDAEEDDVLKAKDKDVIQDIYEIKSDLNFARKAIGPTCLMLQRLRRMDKEYFLEQNAVVCQSVLDSCNQTLSVADSYKDTLFDLLNTYHTLLSGKMNDIMKVLTIFSVVFIPITFFAGVYGMNFEFMPELNFKYSYFAVWGLFILITIGLIVYFKRKGWLS